MRPPCALRPRCADLGSAPSSLFGDCCAFSLLIATPPPTRPLPPGDAGAVIVGKLLEMEGEETIGYNAAIGKFEDLVKAGVIDPMKVVRTALVDAASVASLLTTAEVCIVEAPKPENGGGAGGMGGMGGMGDMGF